MAEKIKELSFYHKEIASKREQFCIFYASNNSEFFGNGTQSYLAVYGKGKQMSYKAARACASRLLTSDNVRRRVNELFEGSWPTDQNVDKSLLFLAGQFSDLRVKMAAIKIYYKLRRRIELPSPSSKLVCAPSYSANEEIDAIFARVAARRLLVNEDREKNDLGEYEKFGLLPKIENREIST